MVRRAIVMALAAASGIAPLEAAPRPVGDSVRYTMARGDTLIRLAERFFKRRSDYATVQRRNHISDPRHIPIGTVLTIPKAVLRETPIPATLIAYRGKIAVERDGKPLTPDKGMVLQEGDRIITDASSFATFVLANGSRITLPSQTAVRLATMRRLLLNDAVDFDIAVEKGRAETKVIPIAPGKGWFRLRTPSAVSAVRGTEFRVAYDTADTPSLTEVTQGTVAVGAPLAPSPAAIEQGFGASVSASGKVDTEALLAAPALREPGRIQIAPAVALAFDPVPGAVAYHVQIASDAGFVDIAAEARSTAPAATFGDIGNGNWFVRLTAVAASGLEGMPQSYAMRRVLTELGASAGVVDDGYRFKWFGAGEGRRLYRFQLLAQENGTVPLIDEPGIADDAIVLQGLTPGTYYWRVGVQQYADGGETVTWVPAEKLIIADASR